MKNLKRLNILALILLGFVGIANAQEPDLSKEITIEADFEPVEQKVTKPNTLPSVVKKSVDKTDLVYSNWSSAKDIPTVINKFSPYCISLEQSFSKSKGYVDLGIGSQLNVAASAGYRLIDREEMTLKAWLNHASTWNGKNSSPLAADDPKTQKYNDNVLAVDFLNKLANGEFTANAYYHIDDFNYYGAYPASYSNDDYNQTANEFGVRLGWKNAAQKDSRLRYSAQLGYNHFGYSKSSYNLDGGIQENALQLDAIAEIKSNELRFGVDASVYYVEYSDIISLEDTDWLAMLKASPYVSYNNGNLLLSGGLNLDLSANDGASIRLSPKVKATYLYGNNISVYANVNGGKRVNLLSDYHAICRYLKPSTPIGTSYTPFDAEVGVKIGPFAGFYIKPFFAYGSFKYEKMLTDSDLGMYATIGDVDIKGWNAGAELGYKYNDLLEFTANVQCSPQDNGEGYLTGLDRAELIVDAQVKVTPIKPLAIALGYEARNNRAYYTPYQLINDSKLSWKKTELENVGNLSLNAYYQVNKKVGVFVNASNLLNKQWDIFYGMGAQKLNALVGLNVVL